MTATERHFYVQTSKAVAIFLIAIAVLVGVAFVASGLDRQSHAPAHEWGALVLIGVAGFIMAERLWRYYFLPQMSLTVTHLVIRPFWRPTVRWPYDGTARWAVEYQEIRKDWRGRQLPVPLTVERLVRTSIHGQTKRVVLPGFSGTNAQMLQELSSRSQLAVEHVQP